MGIFDFLGKKSSSKLVQSGMQTRVPISVPAPQAPISNDSTHLELPELPSFEGTIPTSPSAILDLPALPSFEEQSPSVMSAPNLDLTPINQSESNFQSQVPVAFPTPELVQKPQIKELQTEASAQEIKPTTDVQNLAGPVFCDVETYQIILSNLDNSKNELAQLHLFLENSKHLESKMHAEYDSFHSSLSLLAKKMLLVEAKLFR